MAKRSDNGLDASYRQWASGLDRSGLDEVVAKAAAAEEKPVAYKYRPYAPRKPSKRALEEADEASYAIDETGDDMSIDQRLERLSARIVRRMELDLQYFSVPQLLTGLQRCLQVRVLLLTIQQKGGGSNVGSAVRKYSQAFKETDDPGHGKTDRRPEPEPADDLSNIYELIAADSDDEPDDSAGSRSSGTRRMATGRSRGAASRNPNSRG